MSWASWVASKSPLGWWRLGEASAVGGAVDASGNSRTMTYGVSGLTYGVTGSVAGDSDKAVTAGALSAGATAYVAHIAGASWMNSTSAVTLMGAVKTASAASFILTRWDTVTGNDFGAIDVLGGKARCYVLIGGTSFLATGATSINDGHYWLVFGTFDGTTVRVYIVKDDGTVTLDGSTTVTGGGGPPYSIQTPSTDRGLTIGGRSNGTSYSADSAKTLDEAAIFGSAFSLADIQAGAAEWLGNKTAAAALAGTANRTATAAVGKIAAAALTGTGSRSAAAVRGVRPTAALAGTGSIVASISLGKGAAAALAGTGTIAAGAVVSAGFTVTAALTGTEATTADAVVGKATGAALAGTGAIAAAAVVGKATGAALAGTGTIAAAGDAEAIVELTGDAELEGVGDIDATLTLATPGDESVQAALEGTGSIAAGFVLHAPPQTVISRTGGRRRSGTAYLHFDPAVVPIPRIAPVIRSYIAAYSHAAVQPAVSPYAQLDATLVTRRRGRIRTTVNGLDISFLLDVPTPEPSWQLISPGLYGPGRLELPQFRVGWDREGEGVWSFLQPWAVVHSQLIDLDGTRHTLYKGMISDFNEEGPHLSCTLAGHLTGRAANRDRQPPVFPRRRSLEQLVLATVRSLRRNVVGPTVETGITLMDSGGMRQSQWIEQTMAQAQKKNGTRWTLMPNTEGVYELREKDTTTVHYTLYRDDTRTVANVRRDFTEEPTSIYAEAIREDGLRIRNAVFPAFNAGKARPPYPLTSHSATLSQGDTDADTDTGDGVTLLIWKLWDLGFVDILDVAEGIPDEWTAQVTKGLRQMQRKSDIEPADGVLTHETWVTLWDIRGASLRGAKILPTSEDRRVRRWKRSGSGQKLSANPHFDPSVETVDRSVQLGAFYDWDETQDIADQLRWDGNTPNWVGSMALPMGALITGDHTPGDPLTADMLADALLAIPGENVKVVNLGDPDDGGTLCNISAIDKSDSIALTLDTRSRDSMEVWEVNARTAETRHSLRRTWELTQRRSTTAADSIEPWDRLGGKIPAGVTFEGGKWNAQPVIMGKEGQVRDFDLTLLRPATEYAVAVFGTHMHPALLAEIVGNPLSAEGRRNWRRHADALKRRHLLLYAAGTEDNPAGYFPSTKAEVKADLPWRVTFADGTHQVFVTEAKANKAAEGHPGAHVAQYGQAIDGVTGRFKDDAGFAYFVGNDTPGIGWMLVYPRDDTHVQPGRIWKPQLTDQA